MKKIATRSRTRFALTAARWPGKVSPNSEASLFPLVAATPGMTSIALTAKHHLGDRPANTYAELVAESPDPIHIARQKLVQGAGATES